MLPGAAGREEEKDGAHAQLIRPVEDLSTFFLLPVAQTLPSRRYTISSLPLPPRAAASSSHRLRAPIKRARHNNAPRAIPLHASAMMRLNDISADSLIARSSTDLSLSLSPSYMNSRSNRIAEERYWRFDRTMIRSDNVKQDD